MDIKAFSELFPLFSNTNPETLEWLLSITTEDEYSKGQIILSEDSWGNAVYFVELGWVKVRCLSGEKTITTAVLGQGDFFGEKAIIDESPRATDVVAMSQVKLLSISAQRFIQALFRDQQLHHRMLQFTVRRLRRSNARFKLRKQPAALKLAKTFIHLAENYGQVTDQGVEIIYISPEDLADIADVTSKEVDIMITKLQSKGWLEVSEDRLHFTNFKQLTHLAGRT